MTVCYFGAYDQSHPRNRVLMKGLRKNGVKVIECHSAHPLKPLRLLLLIIKYLSIVRKIDLNIVGACGHAYVPLAKLLATVTGKRLIFDAFMSQYDTCVSDRKSVKETAWKARYYYYLDKISCHLSDVVLLDTDQYIDYFCEKFGLSRSKFRRILVGADDELLYPVEPKRDDSNFLVLFVGTFIPLQGVEHIVQAAWLLKKYPDIKFQFVGDGQTRPSAMKLAEELNLNNIFFKESIPPQALRELMARADVCLGIFGASDKAQRVIPCKVYDALAMGKPLITGDTPAARVLFKDKENALLCPVANAQALADAILLLKNDKELREKIALNGFRLFKERATPKLLGQELKAICCGLMTKADRGAEQ